MFSPLSIIPPVLSTIIFIYHHYYTILKTWVNKALQNQITLTYFTFLTYYLHFLVAYSSKLNSYYSFIMIGIYIYHLL